MTCPSPSQERSIWLYKLVWSTENSGNARFWVPGRLSLEIAAIADNQYNNRSIQHDSPFQTPNCQWACKTQSYLKPPTSRPNMVILLQTQRRS